MDTKSRKSHKLAKVIIALCVLLPALVLVSLYPTMEKAMVAKKKEYEQSLTIKLETNAELEVTDEFINYAMEASYYVYGQMLNEQQEDSVNMEVLEYYGWKDDYYRIYGNSRMQASLLSEDGQVSTGTANTADLEEPYGTLKLDFDAYGNLGSIGVENLSVYLNEDVGSKSLYEIAMLSERQYQANVNEYNQEYSTSISADDLKPKNFVIEFSVDRYSYFVDYAVHDGYFGWQDEESLYLDIGAYWLVLGLAIMVVVVALILPFIRPLNTGREKIFSIPFEITCLLGIGVTGLMIGMCFVMSHTTMWELESVYANNTPEFLGYEISIQMLYRMALVLSFIAWAIGFFVIYIVTANLRQLFSHTKYYLKHQILCVCILRWLKRKCKKLYHYVTDIDIDKKLNASIIKIVIANLIVLTVLCCMWFFGVVGLIAYSTGLYVLLRKYGQKIQKQYNSILQATEKMADGDLKISLDSDLGVFQPMGDSLEKVQQGFEKAVVEEAKSQSMKTELITNVSHDLKTPLTAIITYVDLLKREDITEQERQSYIATLEQKSQRLKVLIEDLFEVSKANSGNMQMNYMDVDVVSLIKQVRSEMSAQLESSELQFRWNLPDEELVLSLDGQRTYRVFENLLNNILKYAMPRSRVYVDMYTVGSQVQVQFRNISAMELDFDVERLTERFVRGDSARNSEGSGLGLAIAKSFVELQNGNFCVEVDGDLFKVTITFSK